MVVDVVVILMAVDVVGFVVVLAGLLVDGFEVVLKSQTGPLISENQMFKAKC